MFDFREIELDKINYHKPRKNKGRYIGKVLYHDQEINITIPYLRCMGPITISENRCYLELELDTDDKDLYDFFADLDDINTNVAYQNSKSWFGEQFPLDVIDDYYKGFIRFNTRLKRPYIKIKIPYDEKILLKKLNVDDFKLNVLVSAKLHHDGLRFYKQQFTSEWSLVGYEIESNYEFKENLENVGYNGTEEKELLHNNPVQKKYEENIETNLGENVEETNLGENVEETNLGENVEETNLGENVEETNLEENVEETNLGENVGETNLEENVGGANLGENIVETNLGENVGETNLGENVEEIVEEYIEEKPRDKENRKDLKKRDKKEKRNKSRSRPKIIKYAHKNRIWN